MKTFLLIMMLVFLTGCRASLESKATQSRQRVDEIGVVLHRVDSLCSTISEKHNVRIEFYEPTSLYTDSGSSLPAAPSTTLPAATVGLGEHLTSGGGMGAVKSIEITSETEASTQHNAFTDSTAVSKTAEAETLQRENASEAKHDNGTVFIVAVVAAVVLLMALLIIIKKLFHK